MKIICTQENLKWGLTTVGRIISPNNTLPILNNFLLKTENGLLKISSTNLEVAITTQIRCKIEEEGEVTVFSKTFTELVNNLPNTNISLETKNGEIQIEADNYHTHIKTLPAEDFPLIPQIEKNNNIVIPGQEFKKALEEVMFAASTNQTQPEIAGVLVSVGEGIKLVATDRYRLAEKKMMVSQKPGFTQDVILPQKTAQEICRIIGGQTEDVEINLSTSQIGFTINSTQIISRLVDGQYPEYKEIIPTEFKAHALVDRKKLIGALKAGGIFSHSTNSVALFMNTENGNISLESESSEVGKSKVEIPAEIKGEAGSLLLNFHYVLDCLNSIQSEKIQLKIIDDNSPALIVPEDDVNYIYLVMPIKN
ncbi:MAG: DNA polymerase III subunit beta [Candidatus Doudnabacteria bacterium]|nr:DNA polymerase III subunit beta [Candidatus Doudnabacteria bacterium]